MQVADIIVGVVVVRMEWYLNKYNCIILLWSVDETATDISVGYSLVWEEHVVKYIVQIRANGFQDLSWELLSHTYLSAPGFGTDGV